MRTTRNIQKTLAAGLLSTSLLFCSHFEASAGGEAALIKWAGEKAAGSVVSNFVGMGLDLVFGQSDPNTGATPAQVEDIVKRVLKEQLTQQTNRLETFMVSNGYKGQIYPRRMALANSLRTYTSIRTGRSDRLNAAKAILDHINYLDGFIYYALGDNERRTRLPAFFFELYSMHNALIPLRIAIQSEIVLNSNALYEEELKKTGNVIGRSKSDGWEVVAAAADALSNSAEYWSLYYPGHLNNQGGSLVSTYGCFEASKGQYLVTYTGRPLRHENARAIAGPSNFRNLAGDLQPMNNSLAHTMDVSNGAYPRFLRITSGSFKYNGQTLSNKVCGGDLAVGWTVLAEAGRSNAVLSGRLRKWFDPFYASVITGEGTILTDEDIERNPSVRVRPTNGVCYYKAATQMFSNNMTNVQADWMSCMLSPRYQISLSEARRIGPVANIGWYTSFNYWRPQRNVITGDGNSVGVFVGPHATNPNEGVAYRVSIPSNLSAEGKQQYLNALQVKVAANSYGVRFGGNYDVVRDTHGALLDVISQYMNKNSASNKNGIVQLFAKAKANYLSMHCPTPVQKGGQMFEQAALGKSKSDSWCESVYPFGGSGFVAPPVPRPGWVGGPGSTWRGGGGLPGLF